MTKKVGIQLPKQANPEDVSLRYALELEGLEPIAEIVEVQADSPEEYAEGVKDMDAIITSWGFRIDKQVISSLEKCVVIGVGSVGVDMVDIEAATEAGIVVTNVPDVFIEEVADHAMALLLGCARIGAFPLREGSQEEREDQVSFIFIFLSGSGRQSQPQSITRPGSAAEHRHSEMPTTACCCGGGCC